MCGRIHIHFQTHELFPLFPSLSLDEFPLPAKDYYPSEQIPIITYDQSYQLSLASWGFQTSHPKAIINARLETIDEKVLFKGPFQFHHCLVPVNGFYEWSSGPLKQKYLITCPSTPLFMLGGLYRMHRHTKEVVIITTFATRDVAAIHERMPLVIEANQYAKWLTQTTSKNHWMHQTPLFQIQAFHSPTV